MRKTLAASLCIASMTTFAAIASATPVTTIDFNGTIGRGNNKQVKTNGNGSFDTYTESGYTVATANSNSFVPETSGLTGNAGNFLEGGAGTGIVNQNGTVYITDGSATTFTLVSFSVYYDGTDPITFNVEGSDSPYSSPNGGISINTSDYTCNIHGRNCTDGISTGSAGWYTVTIPTTTYYNEYSIQLNMGTNAPSNAIDGLDSIALNNAPEPSSLALLGSGLIGGAAMLRRRRLTV